MKYRELTPNEIEAYNIGYKNGSRQAVIKVLEYETPEEKMFYRQGYNAGCQDRKRHNVKTCEIGSNVSNVSNVKPYDSGVSCESCDSTIANNNTITNTIVDSKESIGGVGGKRETIDENTPFKAGGQMWTMPLQFRKLAKKYWTESEIREIEIEHSCHEEPVELTINDLLTIKPPKPKTTRFIKPTVEEIAAYCEERNNGINAEYFFDSYEGKGWLIGKTPMKDWKAAVRTWEKRNPKSQTTSSVNFTELVALWNEMASRLKLQPVSESDLMPERKAEIEKIVATKKPKDLKSLFDQLEKIILRSPKLLGRQDVLGSDGHWFTKELGWQASFAFCFSTKGWSDIMAGKYNGESK